MGSDEYAVLGYLDPQVLNARPPARDHAFTTSNNCGVCRPFLTVGIMGALGLKG